jgi:glycosyltransferase involved in cell wall biosynthesis
MARYSTLLKIISTELKFNGFTSELFGLYNISVGLIILAFNRLKAADKFMRAHRATRSAPLQKFIEKLMRTFNLYRGEIMKALIIVKEDDKELLAKRIFVLKEPRQGEKGVLIVSFDIFGYLGLRHNMKKILNDYSLILEPSWSGYCAPEIMQFLSYPENKIIVQATEKLDYEFIRRLHGNLIPIDIGASNWVDERIFDDLNLEKIYDCIMVAQWGLFKRHHILFDAIKKLKDPSYRACLIGAAWGGRTRQDIEELIAYYGLKNNIDIFEKLRPEEVNELLNKSKVGVLLSRKEGSNRAIFEGMFANVPAIVLKDNTGVNKSYINDKTGVLIDRSELGHYLDWFRENYGKFQPRKWALENITCQISTARLEELLKRVAEESGQCWSRGIETKVNRPEFQFYDSNIELKQLDLDKYPLPIE